MLIERPKNNDNTTKKTRETTSTINVHHHFDFAGIFLIDDVTSAVSNKIRRVLNPNRTRTMQTHIADFILLFALAFMSISAPQNLARPSRFASLPASNVWTEFSMLWRETRAINLGQVNGLSMPSCGVCGSPVVAFSIDFAHFISV